MIDEIKKKIAGQLINIPGWKTKRKILVIESDDWGTIRLSSKKAKEKLLQNLSNKEIDSYNTFDSLESNSDLEELFEVLKTVTDKNGKNPIITANNIVANPNFDSIKKDNFAKYHYEVFTKTLERYPNHDQVEKLYKQGIKEKIFLPQFHGREHIHFENWLSALRSKEKNTLNAFENNMFTFSNGTNLNCNKQFLDAFGTYSNLDYLNLKTSIKEGTEIFEKLWGYKANSVMAPCCLWNPSIESIFKENNLLYIQSYPKQEIPKSKEEKNDTKRLYTGLVNNLNQIYTIRNAKFEPSLIKKNNWVDSALNELNNSFIWNKPAILASHRVNFIGYIEEKNRRKNLETFKALLKSIVKKWPNIEFMSSDQLGNLIDETTRQK